MPKPELPSPLPPRPAIPISYFAELEREIRTTPTIPLERQFAIIATLRAKLYTREDASARIMLGELRNRTDITYSNAVDIERMLASPVQQQTAAQPQQQPQPNPQTEPRHHQRAPEPPPTQHATAPQPPAYQQGTQQPPPVYAPSNFQQAAPHPAAHPGYVHPPQPSERSASGASFSTVVRYGLVGIGALFVLLALFGLDYVSFKQPNGTAPAESFGQMGDLVTRSDVSGVPGLSKVFFEWLGYILLIGLLVTAVLCVLLRRVPRALLVTCLCVAGLAMLFTIVSVVLLANRSKAQGYPVGYEVGFWFTIIAVVMLAIAAVIPHRRATAAPWRPAAPAMR
jgi:amino acid transporter